MSPATSVATSPTPHQLGLIFFSLSMGYCLVVVFLDSISNKRLAISQNLLRHLLDGLTFATGVTVGMTIFYEDIFALVTSNVIYAAVSSGVCTLGPLMNLAERYGLALEH